VCSVLFRQIQSLAKATALAAVTITLSDASSAAACRHFSIWHFPWPQPCPAKQIGQFINEASPPTPAPASPSTQDDSPQGQQAIERLKEKLNPAIAGEHYVDRCTVNHNEDWRLVFDVQHNVANFWNESDTRPVRYGTYHTQNDETYIKLSNNTAAPMDLKLRPNHDPSGTPVLEWTSGTVKHDAVR
jgi:hypothetical protein